MTSLDPATRGRARARRQRLAVGVVLSCLTLAASAVHATEGERYPRSGDETEDAAVRGWEARIAPPVVMMCTGKAELGGSESLRDAHASTPLGPWVPMTASGATPTPAGTHELSRVEGEDTDASGCDAYLYYRVAARRGSVFVRVIVETEDGEDQEWSVRYRGTETVRVQNGLVQRADLLVLTNRWSIAWNRRVVDFDARDGEFDEEKTVLQDFAVACDLLDGSSRAAGESFTLSRPSGAKARTGGSLSAGASQEKGALVPKLGLSLDWGTEKTYPDFVELTGAEAEHVEGGEVVVADVLRCPTDRTYELATSFSGDLACYDHEWFSGSKGARQELTLEVVNVTTSVLATECVACDTPPPPPPTAPVRPPPPTTPPTAPGTPPTAPTTPTDPAAPVTPADDPPTAGPVLPTPTMPDGDGDAPFQPAPTWPEGVADDGPTWSPTDADGRQPAPTALGTEGA